MDFRGGRLVRWSCLIALSCVTCVVTPALAAVSGSFRSASTSLILFQGIRFCIGDGIYRSCDGDCISAQCFADEARNKAETEAVAGPRLRKTIYFRNASVSKTKVGYRGANMGYEYQFLDCFGELHLAHGLVKDSVKASQYQTAGFPYIFDLEGGITRPVTAPPPQVEGVSLRFEVSLKRGYPTPAGLSTTAAGFPLLLRSSDLNFGRALGFGCYTGQTAKVGLFTTLIGPKPTKEQKLALIENLIVDASILESLSSPDAEREARAQLTPDPAAAAEARKAAAESERTARLNREVAERDAAIKRRNAEIKAADERRQREYLQALAAQKAEADRIKREDAAARARYEADMAAWRARVAACNAGVVSQCQ